MPDKVCLKCQGPLRRGYLLDAAYGGPMPGRWVEGDPRQAVIDDLSSRPKLVVHAYRCTVCGYLEFYAHDAGREPVAD